MLALLITLFGAVASFLLVRLASLAALASRTVADRLADGSGQYPAVVALVIVAAVGSTSASSVSRPSCGPSAG